jgi:hypothetical protein
MALTIDGDSMSGDHTRHTARRVPGNRSLWEVSWLPGRHLDHSSAVTAMAIADMTSRGGMCDGHRECNHIRDWAIVLGLTAPGALALTASPPGWAQAGKSPLPADPEAAG